MFVKHFLKLNAVRRFSNGANRGQAAVEYFVLFALIAVVTLLSLCTLYPRVYEALSDPNEGAFQKVIELPFMHSPAED